mmetsp:Transcript_19113/g.59108  ORF Transcript_19113/g.59108 Transcript_19113/m.59108 type:complete len:209 (-) Transcript_19113:266-892(-)
MLRLRVMVPPPHDLLHVVHMVQSLHLQSTGQPSLLQAFSSLAASVQSVPPLAGSSALRRNRMVVPPPHVFEQLDQLSHSVHVQFTGQPSTLQSSSSTGEPVQGLPPLAPAATTERLRTDLPPPQLLEQAGQALQGPHLQSTAQAGMWQDSSMDLLPSQSLPPCWASTARVRLRERVPLPQLPLQVLQAPQLLHLQSRGQAPLLQSSCC